MANQALGRSRLREWLFAKPWLLYGIYFFCIGTAMYLAGVLLVVPRYLGLYRLLTPVSEWLVWYSGIPMVLGLVLALLDLLALFEGKRPIREYRDEPLALLWQIYSRCCFSPIDLLQYGHRCGGGRSDEIEDGVAHGGQAWLRWWPVDSFFPAPLLRGGDAGGKRRRSSS